ncbi:MAG: hypothetical protein KDE29_11460 [Anaerolineales bacterium]|nr:hypothetical protein [Anaerolineales bacterium]
MKNKLFFAVLTVLLLVGCQVEQEKYEVMRIEVVGETPETTQMAVSQVQEPSCAQPTAENAAACQAMEAQILATTVRLELRRWDENEAGGRGEYVDGGICHATVMDGRYLVTHNHFSIPLQVLQQGADGQQVRLSVYDLDNRPILKDLPLTAFDVMLVGPQTLLLDFQEYGGQGLLTMLGLPSASFADLSDLALQPGREVAQIDWDGTHTQVDWVRVEAVVNENGALSLQLANGLTQGASGGGVFWQGVHIANNWTSNYVRDKETGDLLGQYSVAALNELPALAVGAGNGTAPANG